MKSSIKIKRGQIENAYKNYTDIAGFLADQANQSPNRLYKVIDTSLDPNLTFPSGETRKYAYYEYNGVATGSIDDYMLISAPYAVGSGLQLGETDTEAYRGDRGKTAYDHSQLTAGNPHNVTKSDVGLPNVDNTSDTDKPVSTATSSAITASSTEDRKRSNHTGTQLASTISDFQTEVSNNPDVQNNTAKVTNVTHTGEVTGATVLTITPKAVTNAKLADVATKTLKGRTATGSGEPKDLTVAEVRAMLNVADGANVNVQPDWEEMNSAVDAFIKHKPNQINFNIYNQNKKDKKVVSTTTKTSIITVTTGVQALPSYNLNDSFIGKMFGFFDNSGSTRAIQVFFGIGNREYSTSITTTETGIVDFSIDYKIDFPIAREASITGVLKVGNTSKYIDLDFALITGLDYDIKTTLNGGALTVNSSHIHRNYN